MISQTRYYGLLSRFDAVYSQLCYISFPIGIIIAQIHIILHNISVVMERIYFWSANDRYYYCLRRSFPRSKRFAGERFFWFRV